MVETPGSPASAGVPAVFLDRDGTLIREVDYLSRPEDLELLPGVAGSLARLRDAGKRLVVVTNQSGLARGLFTQDDLERIHAALSAALAREGVELDYIGFCPHHPDLGPPVYRRSCGCRKPRPGLLLEARRALGLDLSRSWIVGDAERDLAAGAAVGVRGILVATGKGAREFERLKEAGRAPQLFVADLDAAAERILAEPGPGTGRPQVNRSRR